MIPSLVRLSPCALSLDSADAAKFPLQRNHMDWSIAWQVLGAIGLTGAISAWAGGVSRWLLATAGTTRARSSKHSEATGEKVPPQTMIVAPTAQSIRNWGKPCELNHCMHLVFVPTISQAQGQIPRRVVGEAPTATGESAEQPCGQTSRVRVRPGALTIVCRHWQTAKRKRSILLSSPETKHPVCCLPARSSSSSTTRMGTNR